MKTANELFQYLLQTIAIEDIGERKAIAFWLIEHYTGLSKTAILLNDTLPEVMVDWPIITQRINQHEPIQYILGKAPFYGRDFMVNRSVLIPRNETEELIELILDEIKTIASPNILDIGTGSGCIAISLAAERTEASVTAFDISEDALGIAIQNAIHNDTKVTFEQQDILNTINITEKWDVIVSNPPYITEDEKIEMQENVVAYEPSLALFVPNENPLLFYNAIADFAKKHLKENGLLYIEINQKFGKETAELISQKGFKNVEIIKDLNQNERFIRANS